VRNTGFLIDHRLFHPGDAYTDPGVPVDLLLLPLHGLYTHSGPEIDYVRHLKPAQVSPIHDATLNSIAMTGLDAFFGEHPTATTPGTGAPYARVPLQQTIEL
jgi:hypothetical protein